MFLVACNEGLVWGTREICLIFLDWQERSWLKLTTYSCISSCVFNRDLKDTHSAHWACCSWSHDRTLPFLQENKPLSLQHSQLVFALLIKQFLSHSSNCLQYHNIEATMVCLLFQERSVHTCTYARAYSWWKSVKQLFYYYLKVFSFIIKLGWLINFWHNIGVQCVSSSFILFITCKWSEMDPNFQKYLIN